MLIIVGFIKKVYYMRISEIFHTWITYVCGDSVASGGSCISLVVHKEGCW